MECVLHPLDTQVAGRTNGHGFEFLQLGDSYVLKPLEPGELKYYEDIYKADKSDRILHELKLLMPKFYGTYSTKHSDFGGSKNYIKLEDITRQFALPCVMDIKMGYISWTENASAEKIARAKLKFPPRADVGFQLRGMRVYNRATKEFDFYDKGYFKAFQSKDDVTSKGFVPYLSGSGIHSSELARAFLRKLDRINSLFMRQKRYAYIASSLLLVYDAAVFQRDNGSLCSSDLIVDPDLIIDENHNEDRVAAQFDRACDVRMIDFAHATPTDHIDDNYLGGLQCLTSTLEGIAAGASSA